MSDPPTVSRGRGGRRQLILLRAKTLHGGYLGSFVRICPRVQSVEHGQLRVIDDVNGVVESIGRILLGPIRVSCRGLGVQLVGPLFDLCLDVLSSGSCIGLHLGPLALGSVPNVVSLLLDVLHDLIRIVSCLLDALLELVAVLHTVAILK